MTRPPVRSSTSCSVGLGFALLLPCLGSAACLSSAPPAPPVRWFDPSPAAPAGQPVPVASSVRVVAPSHLGTQLLLRTGVREYVFDAEHQWIAPPTELVATALQAGFRFAPEVSAELQVGIERFELDLTVEPRAVVRLHLVDAPAGWPERVEGIAAAADRSPAALAAAMSSALADVVQRLRSASTR
ncbi:MAG: hypothetical protein JNL12_05230 [Planctomycetes bacterium]|nr:hypothetical protein [Planctomycetota bacterium]